MAQPAFIRSQDKFAQAQVEPQVGDVQEAPGEETPPPDGTIAAVFAKQDQKRKRKRRVVVLAAALVVLIAGLCAWRYATLQGGIEIARGTTAEASSETASEDANEAASTAEEAAGATASSGVTCTVHVDGAVVNPGVYTLDGETVRIRDAVEAAGGLAADAVVKDVNLAAKISDGVKVYIPREGESATVTNADGAVATGSTSTSSASASTASSSSSTLVNINTATLEELCTLNGVGEATAQAIIDERTSNGAFTSPEDIMRVSGIGEKKYAKIKDAICV
jgi:competence protein ComEA